MSNNSFTSFVRKNPVATAAATVIIAASGVYFTVRSLTNNNVVIQQWEANIQSHGSGASVGGNSVATMTSSGTLTLSGTLLVSDQRTGSGKVAIHGTDGGKLCVEDTDGAGYTRFDCLNGTCTAAIATGNECP